MKKRSYEKWGVAFLAVPVLVSIGCSKVQFGAIDKSAQASLKSSNIDVGSIGEGADGSGSKAQVNTVNYRECTWHETGETPVYTPDSKPQADDLHYAFLNVQKGRNPSDLQAVDLNAADSAVIIAKLPSSKMANGRTRFQQLEVQMPSFEVDKDALDKLKQQALDSASTSKKLNTVLIVFNDGDHDGKFSSRKDVVVSSSIGVPVIMSASQNSAGLVSSVAMKGFASSALPELSFQLRTKLMNTETEDDHNCAAIKDAEFRAICQASCDEIEDPLVIDLGNNGIVASSVSDGVQFDLTGSGSKQQTAWLASNDNYFLVMDRNGNQQIDDGRELFGTSNVIRGGLLAANGFESLADLDSNGDGMIDSKDAAFAQLKLWNDSNRDGKSSANELIPLSERVQSLSLSYRIVSEQDENGNRIYARSSVTLLDGRIRDVADVWLANRK